MVSHTTSALIPDRLHVSWHNELARLVKLELQYSSYCAHAMWRSLPCSLHASLVAQEGRGMRHAACCMLHAACGMASEGAHRCMLHMEAIGWTYALKAGARRTAQRAQACEHADTDRRQVCAALTSRHM